MARRFIRDFSDGNEIDDVYLVAEKQLRANRNGNLYLQIELRDRTGSIGARLWNAGEHLFRSFENSDFLVARGKVQLFQGALQVILSHIERTEVEKIELADFLPHTDKDVTKLLERLRGTLLRLGNPHLRALAELFLMDEEFIRAFSQVPAGVRNHHAYLGGLLEHVVTLMDAAQAVVPLYPGLDRDLLLMGVFLHDIGKVRELSFARDFSYTDEGQLIGHLVIGVEMLNEKAARTRDLTGEQFPTELLFRLKHMILSHNGTYEFGSPRLPMTPEAIALHLLDTLDAKVHSFTRDIREDRNQTSSWTPFSQATQRRLFKGTVENANGLCSDTFETDE
jgi:3'-5' exoribonuclease